MKKLPEFSINPLAAAGIFLLLFAFPPAYSFAAVTVTLLHEAGHLCAALMLGEKVRKITVMPVGINITMSPAASYTGEILTALAGPFENLLLMLCAPLFPVCGNEIFILAEISFLLNILPVPTLDGGRVLSACVSFFFGADTGEKVVRICGLVCLFFLWIIAVYIFFYTAENAALLIFCSYLFAAYIISRGN